MIAEIGGAVGAIKSAYDLTKALRDAHSDAEFSSRVSDLQKAILEAQGLAIESKETEGHLRDEIRQLKAEIEHFHSWEEDAARYTLTEFGGGTFAYVLKAECSNGEPIHMLCANCFQDQKKAILQEIHSFEGDSQKSCPRCKQELWFGNNRAHAGPIATNFDYNPLS